MVGHVAPEAARGGTIGLVQDGDTITIDAKARSLHLHVSNEDLAQRREQWTAPDVTTRGVLGKFAKLVSSASRGAVTDG